MAISKANTTAAAPEPRKHASMSVGAFSKGGLLDDVDVEITDAATTLFDYNGQQAASPALALELTDRNGAAHVEYLTAGKLEDWAPDESGSYLDPVSGKTTINESTKLARFLTSLVSSGFPNENLEEGNLKVLIGTQIHVIRETVERKGLIRKTGPNADRPSTDLIVSKLIALPGKGDKFVTSNAAPASKAAVGGKANGAAKSAPAATPTATDTPTDDYDSEITEILMEALAESGAPINKKDANRLVLQKLVEKGHAQKDAFKAVIRLGKQDFLAGLKDSGIAYDGATLSLAE